MNKQNAATSHRQKNTEKSHRIVSTGVYYRVFFGLMVLLILTVAVAFVDAGPWGSAIALTIAIAKALLIMLFFMHVWYSSHLTQVFAAAALFWLGVLFVLALSDYLTRGNQWTTAM